MHQLCGELLLAGGTDLTRSEDSYRRAIEVAREQKARAIELRAAMELSQIWQKQGKDREARQLLSEIYNWYSEGFEQEELKKAKIVLDCLS